MPYTPNAHETILQKQANKLVANLGMKGLSYLLPKAAPRLITQAAPAVSQAAQAVSQAAPAVSQAVAKPSISQRILNAASQFIAPKVAPNPKLVAQAANLPPQSTYPPLGGFRSVLNYLGNVPKGERFSQRPIMNAYRALNFDGVPGMRRLGTGMLAYSGYQLGKEMYDTHQNVNATVDTLANLATNSRLVNPEQKPEFENKLHNLKWNALYDQLLGRLARTISKNPAPQDFILDQAYSQAQRYTTPYRSNSAVNPINWRSPSAILSSLAMDLALNRLNIPTVPKAIQLNLSATPN